MLVERDELTYRPPSAVALYAVALVLAVVFLVADQLTKGGRRARRLRVVPM